MPPTLAIDRSNLSVVSSANTAVCCTGQVKPESKLYLLNYRKQAGIDSQEHLIAVEKQVRTYELVAPKLTFVWVDC